MDTDGSRGDREPVQPDMWPTSADSRRACGAWTVAERKDVAGCWVVGMVSSAASVAPNQLQRALAVAR